jgi:hypothetical protein
VNVQRAGYVLHLTPLIRLRFTALTSSDCALVESKVDIHVLIMDRPPIPSAVVATSLFNEPCDYESGTQAGSYSKYKTQQKSPWFRC